MKAAAEDTPGEKAGREEDLTEEQVGDLRALSELDKFMRITFKEER